MMSRNEEIAKTRIARGLEGHPRSTRELLAIAQFVPDPAKTCEIIGVTTYQIRIARETIVGFVDAAYRGNVPRFLEDYGDGRIGRFTILSELGRKELGLESHATQMYA